MERSVSLNSLAKSTRSSSSFGRMAVTAASALCGLRMQRASNSKSSAVATTAQASFGLDTAKKRRLPRVSRWSSGDGSWSAPSGGWVDTAASARTSSSRQQARLHGFGLHSCGCSPVGWEQYDYLATPSKGTLMIFQFIAVSGIMLVS